MFAQAKKQSQEFVETELNEGAARVVDLAKTLNASLRSVNEGMSHASQTARNEIAAHPLRFSLIALAVGVASAALLFRSKSPRTRSPRRVRASRS